MVRYRYQVYVPEKWSRKKKWPVILFLHGAGERGDDGLLPTDIGIGAALRRHKDRFPCIIVMPQCRKNLWWSEPRMEAQALKALDQTVVQFNGDPCRIYLTGISMGGYGLWSMAARHPGRFAALAPICGGICPPANIRISRKFSPRKSPLDPYTATARKITGTPIWIFHGAVDPTVPVSESRKMVKALKATRGSVRYSEYRGVGHNSWERAYAEPRFLPWLLSKRLGKQTTRHVGGESKCW